jgi:RecA-family ATPase
MMMYDGMTPEQEIEARLAAARLNEQRKPAKAKEAAEEYHRERSRRKTDNSDSNSDTPAALAWIDMSRWDNEPAPAREWAVRDRVPLRQVGLFSGEGGAGKSVIELMKNVAHVTGKDWLGSMPEPGGAFYVGAEDEEDEIRRRLEAIARHYGVTFKDLSAGGLKALCLLGQDATLCATAGKSGKVETTALYRSLYEQAGDLKPKNISIDTLSRAFAGSEIDRVQVYGFATHMQALAMAANGSVTVLSHPSLAGIASGTGISGSTAWHGAFRFRQYLRGVKPDGNEQPDDDLRELEFKKNQYGPRSETLVLRYDRERHLFLPIPGVNSLDRAAKEAAADDVFLALLRRFTAANRNVSDKVSANYAPALFAREDEAKKASVSSQGLAGAMRRLFKAGTIWNEPYGRRASRASYRLAIKA